MSRRLETLALVMRRATLFLRLKLEGYKDRCVPTDDRDGNKVL